jgi:hypothetical protein
MTVRRAGSSIFGIIIGLVLVSYGVVTICGYDVLAHLSSAWIIGGTAVCFGLLLLLWAFSEKLNIIGGDTVSMVVGVIVALVVISSFVRENEREQSVLRRAANNGQRYSDVAVPPKAQDDHPPVAVTMSEPAWLHTNKSWTRYLGGGSDIAIATAPCKLQTLKPLYPYEGVLAEPIGGYPVPLGHRKKPICWAWRSGTIAYGFVNSRGKLVTSEIKFGANWEDFSAAWYKEDWAHSQVY